MRMNIPWAWFTVALVSATAWAAPGVSDVSSIALVQGITNRADLDSDVWYAKFEIAHEGPAYLFEMPEAEYGQQYRYRCIEEWWTDGTRCAVAVTGAYERYLDDTKLPDAGSADTPLYAYVKNGSEVTYIDFRHEGRKLALNAPWPYGDAAIPVWFGRNYSETSYVDVLSIESPAIRADAHLGKACSVVTWNDRRARVESWLANDLEYLCIREIVHVNDMLVLDRAYDFGVSKNGMRYPTNAVERFVTPDGSETMKSWELLEFDAAPKLPFYVFEPSLKDAALVLDVPTGAVVKTQVPTEDTAP